jgi:hypothetical protein
MHIIGFYEPHGSFSKLHGPLNRIRCHA